MPRISFYVDVDEDTIERIGMFIQHFSELESVSLCFKTLEDEWVEYQIPMEHKTFGLDLENAQGIYNAMPEASD
jgi:hypothetical protein